MSYYSVTNTDGGQHGEFCYTADVMRLVLWVCHYSKAVTEEVIQLTTTPCYQNSFSLKATQHITLNWTSLFFQSPVEPMTYAVR